MVCCFAVLWYGCTHKSLIKIGCTRDCADFCKPRETLLVAQSLLDCEVCVRVENERERQRQTHKHRLFRETELPKIPARTTDVKDERERADVERELRRSLLARQGRAVKAMEETHEDREYKTDCAEQWTNDYAENIWQLKYAECEDAAGFEADLIEMKNDREHCEEFGWSVVRESRWDADYAEESDDRIVPLNDSGITATLETTYPSPENAASTSEPAPAARELPVEPLVLACQRSPTYPLSTTAPQAQRNNLPDRELMPPPPLPSSQVPKLLTEPALPTPKMSGTRLLSPPPSSAPQAPSPSQTSLARGHTPDKELPKSPSSS